MLCRCVCFLLQGGSHLTLDKLSEDVGALVRHVQSETLNSEHDVISTVHLLLRLDPALFERLADHTPAALRRLVPAHSPLQVQALEILSVSVHQLISLTRRGAGVTGEKRRAISPPWGQEKRPRF